MKFLPEPRKGGMATLSLIPVVAILPAVVGVLRGELSRRTDRVWSRTRSSMRSRAGRGTLTESIEGSIIWNWSWRRGGEDCIDTPVRGRLPNLICLCRKLPGILDVISHQVGANVQGPVVEKEPLEHEAFCFVDPMIQRKQAAHLVHQGGRLLIRHQGEGHQSLVPLELCEALFEGFIRAVLRGILNEINYLGGVSPVESSHTVVELDYTAGQASDGKLGLGLGKPNTSIICLELWKLDCYSVEVKGEGGIRSKGSGCGFRHCQDRFLLAERKHCQSRDTRSEWV